MAALIFNKKNQSFSNGFSLVEVLVSLTIISVGILSVVNLLTSTLRNWQISAEKVSTIALAQEAMERVRNMRDNGQNISGLNQALAQGGFTECAAVSGGTPYLVTIKVVKGSSCDSSPERAKLVGHLYSWQ